MSQLIQRVALAIREAERYCDLVQSFHYGTDLVVRDFHLPFGKQEILRSPYSDDDDANMEMLAHCKAEIKARAALEAIRVALPEDVRAALDTGLT